MNELVPMPGRALVELGSTYKNIATVSKVYEGKTNGKVVAVKIDTKETAEYDDDYLDLLGKNVYWEEFKEGSKILVDDKEYAFIKLKDIDGYSNAE